MDGAVQFGAVVRQRSLLLVAAQRAVVQLARGAVAAAVLAVVNSLHSSKRVNTVLHLLPNTFKQSNTYFRQTQNF